MLGMPATSQWGQLNLIGVGDELLEFGHEFAGLRARPFGDGGVALQDIGRAFPLIPRGRDATKCIRGAPVDGASGGNRLPNLIVFQRPFLIKKRL
jgi:hypothetical protein